MCYELLYGGYPLIRNSLFLGTAGYLYPDFDCDMSGRTWVKAFAEHDTHLDAYREWPKQVLDSVNIYNPANVAAYTDAIAALYRSQ